MLVFGLTAAAMAQEAPPEDSTEVSDVVVKAPPEEIPFSKVGEGAPALTSRQVRVLLFEVRSESGIFDPRVPNLIVAHTATKDAENIRREAARGLRTQSEVEFAELRRQAAVLAASTPFHLRAPAVEDLVVPPLPAVLEGAKVQLAEDTVGRLMVVSGAMHNTSAEKVQGPSLLVTVVDQLGFILGERAMSPKFDLEPGQRRRFVFFFRVPKIYLGEVRLVLVDPRRPRLTALPRGGAQGEDTVAVRRMSFDVRRPEIAIPVIGEGAPAYSAAQVRRLKQAARDPSLRRTVQGMVDLVEANGGTLAGEGELRAAERATEAARVARRQTVLGRRTQQQVEDAERARQAAVRAAFGAVRPAPDGLGLFGPETPVLIKDLRAERAGGPLPVMAVSGVLNNLGDQAFAAPDMTVTALDAQGFALEQKVLDPETTIGPGQTQAFRLRFENPPEYVSQVRVSPL